MATWVTRLAAVFLISSLLYAHHNPAGEFDMKAEVTATGTITECSFGNPHVMVKLDAKEKQWAVYLPSPNTLLRAGIKKEFCKVGAELGVKGWAHKEKPEMYALRVVLGGVTYRDPRDASTP